MSLKVYSRSFADRAVTFVAVLKLDSEPLEILNKLDTVVVEVAVEAVAEAIQMVQDS